MKLFIVITSTILASQVYAQSRVSSRVPVTQCECEQVRALTDQDHVAGGQRDGTQSVCKFSAFGFNGQVSFQGGWHLTGDIVAYNCRGGNAGSGRTTYGSEPSPLCRVTSFRTVIPEPGRCVHQADTNYDNVISSTEKAAWTEKNRPITSGPQGYVGKASQMAIDFWDQTFSMLLIGSDLCDRALKISDPMAYAECQALPVECRRLNYVHEVNPLMAAQIVDAYSGYSNSLDHCLDPIY